MPYSTSFPNVFLQLHHFDVAFWVVYGQAQRQVTSVIGRPIVYNDDLEGPFLVLHEVVDGRCEHLWKA